MFVAYRWKSKSMTTVLTLGLTLTAGPIKMHHQLNPKWELLEHTVLSDSCRMSAGKERQAGEKPAKERKLRKDKRRLCMCVTHRRKKSSSECIHENKLLKTNVKWHWNYCISTLYTAESILTLKMSAKSWLQKHLDWFWREGQFMSTIQKHNCFFYMLLF